MIIPILLVGGGVAALAYAIWGGGDPEGEPPPPVPLPPPKPEPE